MKKEYIISLLISFSFLSLGFGLLHYDLIGYGLSFFVFLPFTIGYLLGQSFIKKFSLYGLITSLFIFFALLLIGQLEGMICILMSLPLILGAIALGYLVDYLIRRFNKKDKKGIKLKFTILPLIGTILLGVIENQLYKNNKNIIEVNSTITLPYSSLKVYNTIKSVDTLDTEKPFLMKLDLPIPQKCVLENENVGGIRTCYFEGGLIVEKITDLEQGKLLSMDVIDYQLTGRKWLGFKKAIYTFDQLEDNKTLMTRITTYSSELYPRFYWEPLEKIGIEQEHEYVFRNLVKDLKNKYGG